MPRWNAILHKMSARKMARLHHKKGHNFGVDVNLENAFKRYQENATANFILHEDSRHPTPRQPWEQCVEGNHLRQTQKNDRGNRQMSSGFRAQEQPSLALAPIPLLHHNGIQPSPPWTPHTAHRCRTGGIGGKGLRRTPGSVRRSQGAVNAAVARDGSAGRDGASPSQWAVAYPPPAPPSVHLQHWRWRNDVFRVGQPKAAITSPFPNGAFDAARSHHHRF